MSMYERIHMIDQAGIDRMVDLLPIARERYYHPDMHGSWSIKAVFDYLDEIKVKL